MKKSSYLAFICLFFTFYIIKAQETDYSYQSIPVNLLENANAVVRDNSIEITIEDFDRMTVQKREVVTVLNKLGNVDARLVEGYDEDTKITDLSVKVFDANGTEIKKYKKRDFTDVSAVDGGTLYSDSRVKYIDYTPISYPYTIVFESEYKTSTTGFIPWWQPINGYYVSVEKSSYKINNPKKIPWRTKKTNFKDFAVKELENDSEIFFTIENQPGYKQENSAVHYREILPKALIALNNFYLKGVPGSYKNWQEFGLWMHSKLLNGRDALDQSTVTIIKNLVKDIEDPIEKAKLVYQYMQNKTRYISVQVGIGGWEPIAAKEVDRVGYGDCKGLTNYTKALLNVAGVTSYYTVVYADEKRDIDKDFTSIQGNHVILNIPTKNKDVWLECTSQDMPFGFLGDFTHDRNVLVVTPEGGVIKRTASYKDEKNLQVTSADIKLNKDGSLKAKLNIVSKGLQYDDKQHFDSYTNEELIKTYKSNIWSYNNNTDIESVELKNDKKEIIFEEDIILNVKNYASTSQSEYLFRVNVFNRNNYVPKRYRKRKLPLKIYRGYKDEDTYKITLPENYVLSVLPSEKIINSKFGTYKVSFTKINEKSFIYNKTLIIKEGTYSKEDYKSYRTFRRSIAKYENLRIAINKN